MTCPFTSDQICEWVNGEVEDEAFARQLRDHLAECPACDRLVAEFRGALDELRTVALGDFSLSHAGTPCPVHVKGYRIGRELGSGGMGIVYEAEQVQPGRRVALKVIRGAHNADDAQRRWFARESQLLARLNHPNIAAVYEVGATDDDEPFFAMEFVDGVDLLRFVNQAPPLPLRDRLRLAATIARAMGHAHERGIIHRDLKPSNILVTHGTGPRSAATPKILDFGLARALESAPVDARVTLPGVVVGTPAYMSPEQARGDLDRLDIRSDVYSLGVILYEMLTGELPLPVGNDPIMRAVRRIHEQAPRDPRQLAPSIPRDVALIVLKCLAKEPDQRYSSAGALAMDLERYLDGYPISARAPSRVYQLRRFLARNATASVLVSLLLASVLAGSAAAMVQARRIAAERDRVQDEVRKVARLNGVLENLWRSVDPWKAGQRDVRVLDVLADLAAQVELEMADTPLLAAAVRNTLGNTWRSLGTMEDYAESERHLRFAWQTRREEFGDAHSDTARSANDLAETLYWKGDFESAQELLEPAVSARRALGPAAAGELAESLNNLGTVHKQRDRLEEAQRCYDEALDIRSRRYQQALSSDHVSRLDRTAAAEELAQTRNNLGALHRSRATGLQQAGHEPAAQAALASAENEYRAALELRRVWLGDRHPSTATSHNNLARALQDAGKLSEAEQHLNAALQILRSGLGERHQLIARALHNLARLKQQMGNPGEALQFAREAMEQRRALLGEDHRETLDSVELVRTLSAPADPRPGA